MFYRIAITVSLLALPLSSVHAAYQQRYMLSPPSETLIETPTSNTLDGESAKVEDAVNDDSEVIAPMIEDIEENVEFTGEWIMLEDSTEITRGFFTAALVRSLYSQAQIDHCFLSIAPSKTADFTLVFTDVSVEHVYAKEICIAMRDGIIRGYTDGSFAPDRMVTFAESAKMLSRAYALAPFAEFDTKAPWYAAHVRALIVRNAVPVSITKMSQVVTSEEAQEMFNRLQNNITWRPAQKEDVLFPVNVRKASLAPKTTTSGVSAYPSTSSTPNRRQRSTSSSSSTVPASSEGSFWDLF